MARIVWFYCINHNRVHSLQHAVLIMSFIVSFYFLWTGPAVTRRASASAFSSPVGLPMEPRQVQRIGVFDYSVSADNLPNLGFHTFAMAIASLSDSTFSTWNGPSTLFAPANASIQSGVSCSVTQLLREHMVPGIFSSDYLSKLLFRTQIKTMSPGHCITITSANKNSKIYIGGVEITQPDLYNNGVIVVRDLRGFVAPFSPFSCNVERMTSLSLPTRPSDADLEKLPVGTVLPMVKRAQTLVVTTASAEGASSVRINYVRVRNPDVIHNLKIAVTIIIACEVRG